MIYLSIGSNLPSSFGDRFKNIELAISYLAKNKINLINQSSFYETLSFPDKTRPKFINIAASVETSLSPKDLILVILSIEEKLERKRKNKNDPRTCDIDIIDYKGLIKNYVIYNNELNIPHKSLSDRDFVLYPLKEICPDWKHPITKKNIDVLIKNLKNKNNEITKLSQNDINNYAK